MDEAGLPGLYESQWYGWFAPKDTPGNVIVRLNAAVMNALAAPAVRQRLADIACEIPPPEEQTPKPSARCRKPDIEKWWPIVKQANIKAR